MNVEDVLTQARRIVERGWTQGTYADGYGNFCLRGAICLATGEMVECHYGVKYAEYRAGAVSLTRAAVDAVADYLPEGFNSITRWNDHPTTTRDDVLRIIDKALGL